MQRNKLEALRAGLSRLPVNPEGGQFTRGEHGASVSLWKGLGERFTSISAGRSPSLLEGGVELARSPDPFQCGEANVVEWMKVLFPECYKGLFFKISGAVKKGLVSEV